MPASGRPDGAGRETARAAQRVAQGAVGRAEAPEPGEEPHHGQRPQHGGEGVGRPREGGGPSGAGRSRPRGGDPGGTVPEQAPHGGRSAAPGGRTVRCRGRRPGRPPGRRCPHRPGPPPAPPARSAHPGESGEVAAARQAGGDRLRFVGRGDPADRPRHRPRRDRARAVPGDGADVRRRDPRLSARPAAGRRRAARPGPVVLRLRRTDRIPEEPDTETAAGCRCCPRSPICGPALGGSAAELCEVRARRPAGRGAARRTARLRRRAGGPRRRCPSCSGADPRLPGGQRAILAPLRGRRRVIGAAVFLRRPDRPGVRARRPAGRGPARHAHRARHRQGGAVRPRGVHRRRAPAHDAARDAAAADRRPAGQPLSAGRRDGPGRRRLVRRDPAAGQPGRAGRRRRHGPLHDLGRDHGPAAHHGADAGRARPAAAGGAAPPRRAGAAARHATAWRPACTRSTTRSRTGSPSPTRAIRRPCCCTCGGRAEVLRVPPGAPIGVGGVDFEAVELDAPAGRHAAALHGRSGRVAASGTCGPASSSCGSGWPRRPG